MEERMKKIEVYDNENDSMGPPSPLSPPSPGTSNSTSQGATAN